MQQRPQHSKPRGGGRFIAIAVAALVLVAAGVAWALSTQVAYDEYAPVTVEQKLPAAVTEDTWTTIQFKDADSGATYRQALKIAAGSTSASVKVMLGVYRSYEISIASEQSSWRYENEKVTYGNSTDDGGNDTWTAEATTIDGAAATKLPATLKIGTVDKPVLDRTITLTAKKTNDQWESDVASVVNTVTMTPSKVVTFDNQGHGSDVDTQVITADGTKSITEPTAAQVGTSAGLTFDGWYTDAKCSEANKFDSDDFAALVSDSTPLTLYANWIPAADGDALKYWIAPAYRCTTGNTAVGTDVNMENTANYVKEEWNVKKSYAEIQEDLAVLSDTDHATYNTDKYNEVFAEYESFMKNDDYHLYCKYNAATTTNKDDYVEFRILQVGAHSANGVSDGTALTFEATNALPLSYIPNKTDENKGGWAASTIYEAMQAGGDVYNLFPEALQNDALSIVKNSTSGGGSDIKPATEQTGSAVSKFWVASVSEIRGFDREGYKDEGDQYAYYKNIGVDATVAADTNYLSAMPSFLKKGYTRAGNRPTSTYYGTTNGFLILRSPRTNSTVGWSWQYALDSNATTSITAHTTATAVNGVTPCFSLGATSGNKVVFDTQGHGANVAEQYVATGATANDPTADVGTFDGLTLEGWYNNPACKTTDSTDGVANKKWTFATDTVDSSITLYANWIPTTAETTNNYWLAPAYKCTTGSTAVGTDVNVENTANYVNPETNVKKTAAEIQYDVKRMQSGDKKVIAEYKEYMANDSYHLYCKYNGSTGTGLDDYLEFRIVQVGAHTANGASDGTQVTFCAVNAMPYAETIGNTNKTIQPTNAGGWGSSVLYSALNSEGGTLYSKFPTGLVNDAATVGKYSTNGGGTAAAPATALTSFNSKFWVYSLTELTGYEEAGFTSEGAQYDYFKNIGVTASLQKVGYLNVPTAITNSWLTRSGAEPKKASGLVYNKFWAFRSPDTTSAENWTWGYVTGNNIRFHDITMRGENAILPCFAFSGNSAVTFDMQQHGEAQSVQTQYVANGGKASAPTVSDTSGLTLEGWYNNKWCRTEGTTGTTANKRWDFDTDTVTADTTLYANWVPTTTETAKYWLATSRSKTTGNTTVGTDVNASNDNYVSEEWRVQRSSEEIQADVKKIREGDQTVIAAWKQVMNDENYHLYCKWNNSTGTGEDDYLEFRVIGVGTHSANGVSDGTALTFQLTSALPLASDMLYAADNTGGWKSTRQYYNLNNASGTLYPKFPEALRDDVMNVYKDSVVGGGSSAAPVTTLGGGCASQFWPISVSELTGYTAAGYVGEGDQYEKYKNIGIVATEATSISASWGIGLEWQPALTGLKHTRSGAQPTGAKNPWFALRSKPTINTTGWSWVGHSWDEPGTNFICYAHAAGYNCINPVTPCFAFGGFKVAFEANGGTKVDTQYVDYEGKVEKPDDPTRDGYVFKGWYKDSGCTAGQEFDFDNDTISADTTLYAKWDSVADSYWLNYAGLDNPEEGVLKTKSDIQADLAALAAGTGADYERVLAEYTGYMNGTSDSLASEVHLYTKLKDGANTTTDADGNSIAANDYVEWRIVSLGEHAGDGTTVTWQMAHVLPIAQQMNDSDTNAGGYATSALHTAIAEGGSIYSMFEDGFLEDILKVNKTSNTGNKGTGTTTTSDKLWIASAEEIYGTTAKTSSAVAGGEGTQYAYYTHRGVEKGDATNECLAYRTRAGGLPDGQDTDYSEYHGGSEDEMYASWWLRSPSAYNEQTYTRVYNDGRLDHNLASVKRGVALTCAMKGVDYTISKSKMQSVLKGLSAKPTALKFVTGESLQGVSGLTNLATAGIQEDGYDKVGVFQSADTATLYIAPMEDDSTDPADNSYVLHAPQDCSYFLNGTSDYTDLQTTLTTLDLSNLNTSKVTDMTSMFNRQTSLNSLDVSGFDTRNVTNMDFMFYYCSALTDLDVSGLDTSGVTSMKGTFAQLNALESLDISDLDTSSVMNMYYMFDHDASLKTLTFDKKKFDTAKVTNMQNMFYGCNALTSVDVTGFNTGNVTNMGYMFYGCKALTSLDLSSFNTAKVTNANRVFDGCNTLQSVTLGAAFDFLTSGTSPYLPAPNSSYITGADGNWYDTTTDTGYTPANLATFHNALNETRTYVAIKPTNYYWLAAAGASNPSDETAMIKKQSDIDEDLAVLHGTKTETSSGEDKDAVTTRWKGYMNGDTRLYANWKGSDAGTGANRWVEFRILQVGEHDGDGSAVTFMVTHGLTEALAMNTASTNETGWSGSTMRQTLNTAGGYLKTGLSELVSSGHVKAVNKEGVVNNSGTITTTTTSDEFWIPSYSELYGKDVGYISDGTLENEGTQYAWCQANVTNPKGTNANLKGNFKRRDGTDPSSFTTYYTWLRTPYYETDDCFVTLDPDSGSPDAEDYNSADREYGVPLCFAM